MSRTHKDTREAQHRNWMSVYTPSAWNRYRRRRERNRARHDMWNRREPQPRYGDDLYW